MPELHCSPPPPLPAERSRIKILEDALEAATIEILQLKNELDKFRQVVTLTAVCQQCGAQGPGPLLGVTAARRQAISAEPAQVMAPDHLPVKTSKSQR